MTDMPLTPARRALPRLALADLVLPVTVLVILALHLSGPPGPDVAWLTTVSERILAGQQLYEQILESNPPIAAFLYMPAVLLGRLLGTAPEPLIVLQTVGLALASVLYATRLVRRYGLIARPEIFAPLAFMLVGAAWGMDFAQREHFVTMALLPVAVGAAIRAKGERLPLGTILVLGLLAGFAAWVKPYFVLPLVGVGLFYAVRLRSIRPLFWPELLIAAGLFLAYWALTALYFPAYFGTLFPKLAVAYVPDRRPLWMMFIAIPASGFVGVGLIALLTARQHFRLSPLFLAFAVMALGLMASYLAQSKGYFYQVMPAFTFLLLGYLLAFAEANRQSIRLFDKALPLGVALFFAVLPIQQLLEVWKGRVPVVEHLASFGPGRLVANISSDIGLANPAIRQVGGSFINSAPAMLTTLSAWRLRADTQARGAALERINAVEIDERATLREDFKRTPPDLFVTSQDGFDWVGWAAEDPEFGAILAGYEKSADIQFFNEYVTVFRRKGLVPGG
jgi:hypothetical protein